MSTAAAAAVSVTAAAVVSVLAAAGESVTAAAGVSVTAAAALLVTAVAPICAISPEVIAVMAPGMFVGAPSGNPAATAVSVFATPAFCLSLAMRDAGCVSPPAALSAATLAGLSSADSMAMLASAAMPAVGSLKSGALLETGLAALGVWMDLGGAVNGTLSPAVGR